MCRAAAVYVLQDHFLHNGSPVHTIREACPTLTNTGPCQKSCFEQTALALHTPSSPSNDGVVTSTAGTPSLSMLMHSSRKVYLHRHLHLARGANATSCCRQLPLPCTSCAAREGHLSYVQQGGCGGIETMVHLRHPCAQGGEVLHGLAAVIISLVALEGTLLVQVTLEGILHCRQVHVWHCCSIRLLQRAADLFHKAPHLWAMPHSFRPDSEASQDRKTRAVCLTGECRRGWLLDWSHRLLVCVCCPSMRLLEPQLRLRSVLLTIGFCCHSVHLMLELIGSSLGMESTPLLACTLYAKSCATACAQPLFLLHRSPVGCKGTWGLMPAGKALHGVASTCCTVQGMLAGP